MNPAITQPNVLPDFKIYQVDSNGVPKAKNATAPSFTVTALPGNLDIKMFD
jgi:hypothetical protein